MTSLARRISEYPDRLAAALKTYSNTPDASTFKLSGKPDTIASEISELSKNFRNYELSLTYSRKILRELLDSMKRDRDCLSSVFSGKSLTLVNSQLAQSIALTEYLLREIESQLSTVSSAKKALKAAEASSSFADFLNFQHELSSLSFLRQLSVKKVEEVEEEMGRL